MILTTLHTVHSRESFSTGSKPIYVLDVFLVIKSWDAVGLSESEKKNFKCAI